MTRPPDLAGADWLATPGVRAIFAALSRDGDEARIVGGAVRNALLGRPVGEIDFATTALPDEVVRRAVAAGIKAVPTGIEHGTVTLVFAHTGYEVTTLREDVETHGRHATVRFGRDWRADALRRDFTVNALSVDASGHVHDPVGGYGDILARRIRFIGDADQRIAEDRLRILRFFRFHADYGAGEIDRDGLAAAIRSRDGIRALSAERIGQEMRRLAVATRAAETLGLMQDAGILTLVLGGVGYLGPFRRLVAFETARGFGPTSALRLAAIGCRIVEDAERLSPRLRLSNAERDRMTEAVAELPRFAVKPSPRDARRLLYRLGEQAYRDGVALGFAHSTEAADDAGWAALFDLPSSWQAPRFPLTGRDAVGIGVARGPAVGTLLRSLETWWIGEDFIPDESVLRRRLQEMAAAQQ